MLGKKAALPAGPALAAFSQDDDEESPIPSTTPADPKVTVGFPLMGMSGNRQMDEKGKLIFFSFFF